MQSVYLLVGAFLLAVNVAMVKGICNPFEAAVDCHMKDVDFVADDCDSKCFYTCENLEDPFIAPRRCCNPCMTWSQDILTCVRNATLPGCTFEPSTETPVCELSPGPDDYTYVDASGTVRQCAVGTKFNQTLCTCDESYTNPLYMDDLIMCITFSEGDDDLQGTNEGHVLAHNVEVVLDCTTEGGNCGYFNSSLGSYLSLPVFSNAMDHYHEFSVSFLVKRTSGFQGDMGLVNNGNCGMDSSLDIISEKNSVKLIARNGAGNVTRIGPVSVNDDSFVHYVMVYHTEYLVVYVDGVFKTMKIFNGDFNRVYNPMVIGKVLCDAPKFFEGYLDTIIFAKVAFSPSQVIELYNNHGLCMPTN